MTVPTNRLRMESASKLPVSSRLRSKRLWSSKTFRESFRFTSRSSA